MGEHLCLNPRMETTGPKSGKVQRRPVRCWVGWHRWQRWRGANWFCTRCPATKAVDPASGRSVVDTNRSYGKW